MVLNGSFSMWSHVDSGVPQGSVLGPLLFLIYVNDIDDCIINRLSKFADDAKLLGIVSDMEKVESLRRDLSNLYEWSMDWLMLFNIEKCHVIHFGSSNIHAAYEINGQLLSVANEERDLGIMVSSDLKVSK